jgi:dipeptidyl aminopeptidase/acylaminoacyl peptidase
MRQLMVILHILAFFSAAAQTSKNTSEEKLIGKILEDPAPEEIKVILKDLRKQNLSPREVVFHDSVLLSNANTLYIISHRVERLKHYGVVIIPANSKGKKLPVIVFATGGDGMHKQFDISQDFNHAAVQFPNFLGAELDQTCIVVIPSFRGQQLIMGDKKYQSEGEVSDAFGGATTDALAFLNVALNTFAQASESRIAIYGGSRGGTVALLASSRDNRIKRTIAVAAPTDMKALYQLYPDQFKLLFFNNLLAGKISEQEARKKFISISPIYFADELPLVQLHHDSNDPFVPAYFARKLANRMIALGKSIDSYFYDEGIHGFWTDKNYWNRVQEFIRPLSQ